MGSMARKHRKKIFVLVIVAIYFTYAYLSEKTKPSIKENLKTTYKYFFSRSKTKNVKGRIFPSQSEQQQKYCRLPQLELKGHDNVEKYVPCKMKYEWGYLKSGIWYLNTSVTSQLGHLPTCEYRTITRRGDDFNLDYSEYSPLKNGQNINSEVIEVLCKTKFATYNNILVQIVDKSNQAANKRTDKTPYSVVLLSYDSMSRVSWFKRLPRSTEYMLNDMNFDLLYGFNIVGDGTPACMIPLLTGATESELPSTLKSDPNGRYVDEVYPFIWNELHEKGYMSFHMEDWPQVSAFTYRLRGMSNRTAHHYMRTYQLGLWRRVSDAYFGGKDDLCVGAQKRHRRALGLIAEFMDMYGGTNERKQQRQVPFIAITHYIENSHDGNARANHIDADLREFLERIHPRLDETNTVVFLYSDHGARFAAERLTAQGDLEERLPFFSVRLPQSFKRNHPEKYANLLKNAQQLTTPFDIYATIRDITGLSENSRTQSIRSRSILGNIPSNRTCNDVGVSMHYCSCELDWRAATLEMKVSRLAFKFTIDYINNLLGHASSYCVPLKVAETHEVTYAPGISASASSKMRNVTFFKLKFLTTPNNGLYTAVLKFDHTTGFGIESPTSISRVNSYGIQSKCLESMLATKPELMVDLRKFCLCKKYVKRMRKKLLNID